MGTGNMEFDNVQLDVEFSQASERDNITSNENIALSFGKLSTWFEALVPEGGSSGQILGWKSSGTAEWINSPASIDEKVKVDKFVSTTQTDYLLTGAVASMATTAGHLVVDNADGVASARMRLQKGTTDTIGQSMIMLGNNIPSGTSKNMQGMILMYSSSDKYGKIVSESLTDNRTWTLPDKTGTIAMTSDITPNTDTKVTQTNTTASADYRVLLSGNANDTTETTTGHKSANLRFNPSSGGLYSFGFLWTDITGQTLDIDTLTLSDGTLHSRRFIQKTDGGADNITNIPVAGHPFLLEVDLIRWASTTDYITRQRFTNAANGTYSYVRYCTRGTWGNWTTRKYTDTNTKVTSAANHYTPATASGGDISESASGATAAWSIDVVQGVTLNTDGKGHVTGISVTSGKIPANPNTDTKVTSADNHYAPATVSGQDKSASASGATAAWSIDVVKGVTLNTDGKGHVTGLSVTSGKIPANPVPSNNVTGSGTSGYLTKWNGTNTITNGPQLGSSTTTYLRNDGTWATPTNTNTTYTLGTSGNNVTLTPSSGNVQSITVPYATNAATSDSLKITGYGTGNLTFYQANDDFGGTEGRKGNNADNYWSHYIIANHGNGETYYHYTLRLPFWGSPQYQRKIGGSTATANRTRWLDIITEENYTDYTVTKTGGGASGSWGISITGNASTSTKATQDGDGNTISSTYLKLSGGTMTGTLTTKASQYGDEYGGALNMNNSNIYGVNAIYTADVSDNAAEGIHFYRDSTHVDTLWMNGGSLLFVPNRELGTSTTAANSQKVARFTANPTTGQVVITDGTGGGIKSSGYIIAKSVPSNAVFTDHITTVTSSGSGNAVTAISADANGALTVTKGSTFSLSTHTHSNYLPISTVSTSTDADTLFTTTQWINWNTTTAVSTTHMPTTNYGILLVKASPGPQVFFPDTGTGIYLRKKANASTAATAWMGITGAAGSTYNLANFLTSHQSVSDKNVTLAWGTQKTIATIGSTDIHVTLPSNPNTNTTYTIATGDSNGQIKVTPSSGSAYNVNVKGLGSAAYTASTAYVPISGKAPNGVGKDCFIAYPSDGVLNGDSYNGTITGAIIITLPFTKTSGECMMQFMVDIYNYVNETSVSYKISGYCYNDERWYHCSATCVGKSGKPHSNLAVRFGCVANGNYQIQIGETNGSWSYPRIVIRDISILYKQTSYDSYKSGWTISVSTTAISNVTQTITDTHVTSLLQHRTLNSTTINNSAGSFAFSGTQDPWPSTDWVGLQIGDAADKWQITGNGANFLWRQNDSGGTDSANWSAWKTFLDSNNYTSYTVTKTGGGASGSWGISITGSAASAATATNSNNVAVTVKNTEETYGIPFFSGISTGNKAMYTNDGLAYISREGTADKVGYGVLSVGNSIAKGTAGNKRGYVRWHGDSSYIIQVYAENVTADRYIKLPDVGGKMGVLTGTVTSGQIVISDGTDGGIKTSGYTTSSFASSGHSHNSLYGAQSSTAVPVTSLSNGQLKVFYNVNYDLSGNMPATNNANAIIQINRHGGNYDSQLGFSNNGNIYYRSCNNETLDTKGWKTVLDNTNSPAFDSIKQRWVKMGTTKGWRRILTMGASSTSGKTMNDIKIHIRRQYNNGTPESCSFHIVHNYTDTPSIIIDHAIQSTKMITQVRLSKSSDGKKVYVEINYDSTSVNDMTIRYDIIAPNGALGDSYYSNIVVPDNATTIAVVSDSPTAIYTADIPTNIAHADFILKTVNQNDPQYWGMTSPYGEDNIWVRTTSQGIIPYQSGASGSGHCYLGTSGWYFFRAYIDEIYGTSFSGNSSSSDLAKTLYYASISNSASNHATVLQSYFNTNKTSIPRNKTLSFYSSAFGNGSQYMGYFLNGYNDNPYGGFFVAHYDRAFYVGINNGTFAQHLLLTEHNLSTYLPGVLALNSGYIYSGDKMNYDPQSKKFTVTKTTTTWDCQAYSKSGYSDNVYVSFRPGQTTMYAMIGLDANPSEDANYNKIDYCWYIKNDGTLLVYESGTSVTITGHTTYASGDEFRVEYSCGEIRYYHNGTMCRSVARAVSGKLFFDSSFYNAGNVYDFSYGTSTHSTHTAQIITSTYKSSTYVTSLTSSAITLSDAASSFGGWICGPTKNGRIAISSYQGDNDKLYFGYGERGRTTNSYVKAMTWDGPTNTLTADKFVGALQGNASTATTAAKIATEVGTSAGERPVFYAYLGDNTRVVYNTSFTYNPGLSGGVLYAPYTASKLRTLVYDRQSSLNLTTAGVASMQLLLATSSCSTGKPAQDGYVMCFDWDNSGNYQSQFFIPAEYNAPPQYRCQGGSSTWSGSAWIDIGTHRVMYTNDNNTSATVDNVAVPTHTQTVKIVFKSSSGVYSMIEVPYLGSGKYATGLVQVGSLSDGSGAARIIMKSFILTYGTGSSSGIKFSFSFSQSEQVNGTTVSQTSQNLYPVKLIACT